MRKFFYSILIGIAAFFAFTGCSKPPTVASIDVTPPTQVNYYVGDTFSLQGASITAHFSNDSTKTIVITAADVSVSSVDMALAGSKTITVTYKGKSANFSIMVNEVALQSIEATFNPGSQVIYTSTPLNDLKPYLQVVGVNNNGSSAGAIASASYTISGTLAAGASSLTVTYNTVSDTFSVTVVAVIVSSYQIKTPATQTAFAYQESFNPAGLVVEKIYNDGSHQEELLANYTIDSSAYRANVEGTYTIYIKVGASSVASYAVSVAATPVQLQAAKTTKIAELTQYNEADYYTAEWTALQTIRNGAVSAINAFTTIGDVQAYTVVSINASLDIIKTKAEVDAEIAIQLAADKTAKIAELNIYNQANYYATELNALVALYNGAVADINALTTSAAVNNFATVGINASMDAIKTKVEVDAEALAFAKVNKLAALDGIYTTYLATDYYASEWADIETLYANAGIAINAKTSVVEVNAYDVAAIATAMDAIKTKVEVDAEALAFAKVNKLAALDGIYTTYLATDYYSSEWADIETLYANAGIAINAKTSVVEVNAYDVAAIATAMDDVATRYEKDGADLTNAKTAKLGELTIYGASDYYLTQWNELSAIYEGAVGQINDKTAVIEVNDFDVAPSNVAMAAVKTKVEVDAAALASAKLAKQAALDDGYSAYDPGDYRLQQFTELSAIYTNVTAAITAAADASEIQAIDVPAYLADMAAILNAAQYDLALSAAIDSKTTQVTTYFNSFDSDDYQSGEWGSIQSMYIMTSQSLDDCQTLEEVAAIDVEAVYVMMQAVKTSEQITQETLVQMKAEKLGLLDDIYADFDLLNYRTLQWDELTALYQDAKQTLQDLTTLNAVANFDVYVVEAEMDAIKTDAEMIIWESLEPARATRVLELVLPNQSDYGYGDWRLILRIKEDLIDDLSALMVLEEINLFDVTLYQSYIDDAMTLSETVTFVVEGAVDEAGLEEKLGRILTPAELAAVPIIINLMQEYQYLYQIYLENLEISGLLGPDFEPIYFDEASNDYIEFIIGRVVTNEEIESLVIFHLITNEGLLREYRANLIAFADDFLDAESRSYEPYLRVQDWVTIMDAYDAVMLQADALFDQYVGQTVLPDTIELLFLRAEDDFINALQFILLEEDYLAEELNYFLLLRDGNGDNPITDGSLVYTREGFVLFLEGLLEKTIDLTYDVNPHYWLTVGFLVPEGFIYETNAEGQSNISLFFLQHDDVEWIYQWAYAPLQQDLITMDGQRYLVLRLALDEIPFYSSYWLENKALDMRLVFGENLYNPGQGEYLEEDLPGRAGSTTVVTIDFSNIDLSQPTVFVHSITELQNALLAADDSSIYLSSGIYEITVDMLISDKKVVIGPNVIFKNMEDTTLTLANSQLFNRGRIYNYGTFVIDEFSLFNSEGFAYNFGVLNPQGEMVMDGFGINIADYDAVDFALIAALTAEGYEVSPTEEALILAGTWLRTHNFGYLPNFDENWLNSTLQEKEDYFASEFLFDLAPTMLSDLVAYYDYLAGLYTDAAEEALEFSDFERLYEIKAYQLQWYLGSSSLDVEKIAFAFSVKLDYEATGNSDFEEADISAIEQVLLISLMLDEKNAIIYYQNIYQYLAERDFVMHFLLDYDLGNTIWFDQYEALYEVADKIMRLSTLNEGVLFDVNEVSCWLGEDLSLEEETGYLYYLSYYTYANFAAYILDYESALERTLSQPEYRALYFYYGLLVRYEKRNDFEKSDFADFDLWEVEEFYNDELELPMSQSQKDNWFMAKTLEITAKTLIPMLGEMPDQETLDAIPLILHLEYEYAYGLEYSIAMPKEMQDATNEQIALVINRPLTGEEEAALVIFTTLQAQVMDYMFDVYLLPMFEELFDKVFTPSEILLLKGFFYLQSEYESMAGKGTPDFMSMDTYLVSIEAELNRLLATDEKEAVLFMRFLIADQMAQISLGETYAQVHVDAIKTVLVLREEFAYAWSEGMQYPQEIMENTDMVIAEVLNRPLTQVEIDALAFIRQSLLPNPEAQ